MITVSAFDWWIPWETESRRRVVTSTPWDKAGLLPCNTYVSSSDSRTAQRNSIKPEILTVTKLIISNNTVEGTYWSRIKYAITKDVTTKNIDWHMGPNALYYLCTYGIAYYHEFLIMSYLQNSIHLGWNPSCKLDVCGSVHHSIIHKENRTRCNSVSTFYFIFIWSSACFGRHTARHQEPKTVLAASGFACVERCWTCSCWTASNNPPRTQNQRLLAQF